MDKYQTAEQFANDVRQVWINARAYNEKNRISKLASKLSDKFEKYMDKARDDLKKGRLPKVVRRLSGSSSPIINIVDRPSTSTTPAVAPVATAPVRVAAPAPVAVPKLSGEKLALRIVLTKCIDSNEFKRLSDVSGNNPAVLAALEKIKASRVSSTSSYSRAYMHVLASLFLSSRWGSHLYINCAANMLGWTF